MAEKGFKKGNIFPFFRQTTTQRPKEKVCGQDFLRPLYAARPGTHRARDTADSGAVSFARAHTWINFDNKIQ